MIASYKRPTCPDCGQQYRGNIGGGHCRAYYGGCCQTFANNETGDAHRVGPYEPRGARRCLTPQEMLDKGWRLTAHGWTKFPPRTV
jgi:hypothetical protein